MRYKNVIVYFESLHPDSKFPTRKHAGDAGMDFYAYGDYYIPPQDFRIVRTGITVKLLDGYNALLKPNSGSLILLGGGVIENNYQGEILFKAFNVTNTAFVFRHDDKVGQMILIPAYSPVPTVASDIHKEKTSRGADGGIVRENGNND